MKEIEPEIVNTTQGIGEMVDWLVTFVGLDPGSPNIYIDLEGVNLCREGSVSILTLLLDIVALRTRVYLIDVHTLGAEAFNTACPGQPTLKDILQDEKIPKVFFDVRNDSDALFAHYGVALQGVEDVQLMESATRKTTASRKFLNGLTKCLEKNLPTSLDSSTLSRWKLAKDKGERLYKAEYGGSYDVFNQRPIPEDIASYCVGDVQYLPHLRKEFWTHRTRQWKRLVRKESQKRVAMSLRLDYQPHNPTKVMAPWSYEQNKFLNQWNYVPRSNFTEYFYSYYNNDDDDGWDGGPTNCRDIISDDDYHLYYSD